MEDSIYLNNFRGFSDTTVPLCAANFLVGENSTGKTSVLSILTLFSLHEFWASFDFNAGDYEFGGYRDLVSIDSSDKSEFQIGLFKAPEKDESDESDKHICYMLHFREDQRGL